MRRRVAAWLAVAVLGAAACAQAPTDLEKDFRRPPDSARPKTFWQWMNGNVSREGITLDLEALKRVGIDGATIVDGGTYLPKGPVDYLSPQWRELMQHAIKEGNRLGIEKRHAQCSWLVVERRAVDHAGTRHAGTGVDRDGGGRSGCARRVYCSSRPRTWATTVTPWCSRSRRRRAGKSRTGN